MSKQSDLISVSQGAAGDPLFIDTVNDRVGVGTSSPVSKLQVNGGNADNNNNANTIVATGTNHVRLKVHTPTTGGYRASLVLSSDEAVTATGNEVSISTTGSDEMQFATAGTERMRIDTAGRVTTPYQPMFKVNGNTSQWLRMGSAGVWYVITNAVGVNDAAGILGANLSTDANGSVVGSGFNATTGRFTAPVAGLYLFTLSLFVSKISADGAYVHINSEINGGIQGDYSIFGPRPASNGYIDGLNMSWLNYLQANDTWAPAIFNSNVNSVDIYADYVRIGGYLLG